ncbi:hypothetical protein [Bradyrhizobium guangdongense]|uniref:hypothetical protein n=1 Tax=Bradyrhizobium guangdongense TaxID=1325090 RepID=UPI001319C9C1|nr:hypothetical protein [Bradyrhizobium guangdongense]
MLTEAQLLADIALISEIILEHGEKYAPFLDRLEQELEARRRSDPLSRAKHHLATIKKGDGARSCVRVATKFDAR